MTLSCCSSRSGGVASVSLLTSVSIVRRTGPKEFRELTSVSSAKKSHHSEGPSHSTSPATILLVKPTTLQGLVLCSLPLHSTSGPKWVLTCMTRMQQSVHEHPPITIDCQVGSVCLGAALAAWDCLDANLRPEGSVGFESP